MLAKPATTLLLSRALALALVVPMVILAPTSSAHAASTCHGQPATIEASSGTVVSGTPGDDVIVLTGKVKRVLGGDGNDLICLVGTRNRVLVDPGPGDDVVDASAARAGTVTELGQGADSFTGSVFKDSVYAGYSADPGPDQVSTGRGRDLLDVEVGDAVDADLGKGVDSVLFKESVGNYSGDTLLLVDLKRHLVSWFGVTSTLRNAENITGAAQRIIFRGDRGKNKFHAHGCDVDLSGAAGDDFLSLVVGNSRGAAPAIPCPPNRLRAYGNAGDDYLEGGARHDVLVGGSGVDSAFGGRDGHDRCEAELTWGKGCEH